MCNCSVLQEFPGKWITTAFRGCASCNMKTNVATTWERTFTFQWSSNEIFEQEEVDWWLGLLSLPT
jgi:hypothetical protein